MFCAVVVCNITFVFIYRLNSFLQWKCNSRSKFTKLNFFFPFLNYDWYGKPLNIVFLLSLKLFAFTIIYSLRVFHISVSWWSFHWNLSDSKSPQVSRTLLSILTVLNNAIVWMVSIRPPASKSSSPFNNPLVTVPMAPITIDIIATFIFHRFFNSLARSSYLSLFSLSVSFILFSRYSKVDCLQVLFFVVGYYKIWSSDRDQVIRLYA